jgi:hypothetical protein
MVASRKSDNRQQRLMLLGRQSHSLRRLIAEVLETAQGIAECG